MAAIASTLLLVAFAFSGGVSAYYDQAAQSLEQLNSIPAPDSETNSYLIPRLAHKYRPDTGDWMDAVDPKLYLLTETGNEDAQVGIHILAIFLYKCLQNEGLQTKNTFTIDTNKNMS